MDLDGRNIATGTDTAMLRSIHSLFSNAEWLGWMYEWYADTGWTLQPPAMFARYP